MEIRTGLDGPRNTRLPGWTGMKACGQISREARGTWTPTGTSTQAFRKASSPSKPPGLLCVTRLETQTSSPPPPSMVSFQTGKVLALILPSSLLSPACVYPTPEAAPTPRTNGHVTVSPTNSALGVSVCQIQVQWAQC
jgi:hypothetical protein